MSDIVSDTICAISTPAGVGGLAVLRLSGHDAKRLAEKCLRTTSGRRVVLSDRHAAFSYFYTDVFDDNTEPCHLLDEVVAIYFAAPHSYTGEDVVELSCHGSLYVQQCMLQHFVTLGARIAEPGEFTQRAFLNGRMDLSQAEAVADLIDSRSQSAHGLAISQMRGGYAEELEQLRQSFIELAALLELELDFSDEDVEFAKREQLKSMVALLTSKVQGLVDSFSMGNALKNGVPVAIVGRPNVGKSTLLNTLLNEDRAIVSDVAGTTRDTVEEQFVIEGIMFRLIDTAGIRHTDNTIEQAGIARSRKAIGQAAIVLYLFDAKDDAKSVLGQIAELESMSDLNGKSVFLLRNKMDIASGNEFSFPDGKYMGINISAKNGDNIETLRRGMVDAARQGRCDTDVMLTNARHYEAMTHILSALEEVCKGLEVDLTPDLLVIDIRDALYHLGTITGKVTSDEVLSSIFSRFCIGK